MVFAANAVLLVRKKQRLASIRNLEANAASVFLLGIKTTRDTNQRPGEVSVDAPVTNFIGIGQRTT